MDYVATVSESAGTVNGAGPRDRLLVFTVRAPKTLSSRSYMLKRNARDMKTAISARVQVCFG